MKIFSLSRVVPFLLFICTVVCAVPVSAGTAPIGVSAKSAVLVEGDSGHIVWSKNSGEKLPMASTTKIMTALVAIENYSDLDAMVKINGKACGVEGSSVYLKAGEELTMRQLLQALLLESANDAACAIAIEVAGSVEKFAVLMNETAKRLEMNSSHFTNPHGLDHEEHYTTAEDMAKLTVAALKNKDFAEIVSTYKTTIPLNGDEGTRLLLNHNKLLKYYDGAVGVKTGFTKRSGRCLVSAAVRDGVTMIAVTLSAPDDWNDHRAMLDFGFSAYRHIDAASPGSVSHSIPVSRGSIPSVTVKNRDSFGLSMPNDSPEIRCVIEAPRFIIAPVKKDDVLGYACYYLGNEEVARLPLYAECGCDRLKDPSLLDKILRLF
ncbi:MAG: D-alanyl-D-alanine carboxypeptidase [Ruminococcaceae bacterium]|nr:D-alanyl-D-alanine carboxypeptidase [Oscillospiraceae bacterium]